MQRDFAPTTEVSTSAALLANDDRPLLQADGVTKRWPRQSAPILDDLDLQIASGEVVGILGANGAGKTTLLRILTGMIEPDCGVVVMPKHERITCTPRAPISGEKSVCFPLEIEDCTLG